MTAARRCASFRLRYAAKEERQRKGRVGIPGQPRVRDTQSRADEGGRSLWAARQSKGMALAVAMALVVTALSAAQASATAPPLAYQNANLLPGRTGGTGSTGSTGATGGTGFPIVANGEINLTSTIIGKISCLNTFYAQGWNEGTAHSYGEVLWAGARPHARRHPRSKRLKSKKKNT